MRSGQVCQLPCSIIGVEATSAATAHAFPRHTHDAYGIGVIQHGGQRSHSAWGMVEAGPGDTIMVNPGEVHDGLPIDEHGRDWRMLYFDPVILTSAADDTVRIGAGQIELTSPVVRDERLARLFARLFAVAASGIADASPQIRDEACLRLLTYVLHHHTTVTPARAMPASIARARARIDDDPTADVSLADLAAPAGLSRFQVLRGFATELGLTPHAYLIQRRIMLARRLIANGAGLAEAAMASGFADQSHMTRAFVRHLGCHARRLRGGGQGRRPARCNFVQERSGYAAVVCPPSRRTEERRCRRGWSVTGF